MIGTLVYQLTKNLYQEEIRRCGFDAYFVDHTTGVYPSSAAGVPFTAAYLQSKGDIITDLHEDMAAEQKARTTYDNILRLIDDPDVCDVIKFLRARKMADKYGFLHSGGSDYHGVNKPETALGTGKGNLSISDEFYYNLLKKENK